MRTPAATARTATSPTDRLPAVGVGLASGGTLVPAEDAGRRVIAKFFRALGDPNRLLLLEFCLSKDRTVTECVGHVGLAQSRVSAHLACLADCGYLTPRRDGRFTRYQVTDPRVVDLVTVARALAADNASALAACTRIDP